MTDARLTALSPLDGRYAEHTRDLAGIFSEAALVRYRIRVEALIGSTLNLARFGQRRTLALRKLFQLELIP